MVAGAALGRRILAANRPRNAAGEMTRRPTLLFPHGRRSDLPEEDASRVTYTVTLIPGDGIGPEIADASVTVLEATGLDFDWQRVEAGDSQIARHGTPLPDEVLDSIRATRVALKGPITTPIGEGFRSVNVTLRQALDLYANLRPARSMKGVETRYDDVDLVIVRENTETCMRGSSIGLVAMRRRASRSSPARRRSGSAASRSSTRSPTAAAR